VGQSPERKNGPAIWWGRSRKVTMPTRPRTHRPISTLGHQRHVDPDQAARNEARKQERERKRQLDQQRPSARRRGYDRLWEKVRAQQLSEFPLCDCGQIATVVDHIQSIQLRPDLRLDRGNLRSMCKPCHDRRTARDQGFARPKAAPCG
jgi:5-methylcytosine-specific restriction protein A